MKILFIGHYKEGSGWSQATINSILAMHKVGLDVVCRNIKLTNYNGPVHPTIMQLENKPLTGIDICIQNVLPHHIVGTTKFKKNIAYFVGESNTMKHNHWLTTIKLVDESWVPNTTLRDNFIKDGIHADKVKIVPYAFNLDKFTKEHPKLNIQNNNYKFKFYYIGDINDRKNLESIIRCFHSEFHASEPVALVLKINKHGANNDDVHRGVVGLCSNIKESMRIYPTVKHYHQEVILCGHIPEEQIDMIHASCDCFVGASHGEGWSIPSFEAMCFGKTPICSNEGGPKEFINIDDDNTGRLIDGIYSVCQHSNPAFAELFTGVEEWFVPSESDIKKTMRYYYENKDNIDRSAGLKQAQPFSYEAVGETIRNTINA